MTNAGSGGYICEFKGFEYKYVFQSFFTGDHPAPHTTLMLTDRCVQDDRSSRIEQDSYIRLTGALYVIP